jgi:hypothetical protein
LQQHQQAYERARNAQRSPEAQAELAKIRSADQTARIKSTIETSVYPKVERLGKANTNQTYKLSNDDHSIVFKPESGQWRNKERAGIDPMSQWKREIAAGLVAEELGISLVPPTTKFHAMLDEGSGQYFKEGMIEGRIAQQAPHNLKFAKGKQFPADLPPRIAEDWQLMDDLLMQGDRHNANFMVDLDAQRKVTDIALIDNGNSLTANPGVLKKRFDGPYEGQSIGNLNRERLQQWIDNEKNITKKLLDYVEPAAVAGLFARAKALLARGRYGNFTLPEINSHLPPEMRVSSPVNFDDKTK